MEYNTDRTELKIPEYGRNVQRMGDYCLTIEDKEHRSKVAQSIIDVIGNLNPAIRDAPDYAHKLSKKVSNNSKNIGILVCGSGMGMSMAANKHKKIRAAVCYSVKNAKLSRLHNNANIITLGSRLTNKNTAFKCIEVFVNTKFEGGRHKKRIKKI